MLTEFEVDKLINDLHREEVRVLDEAMAFDEAEENRKKKVEASFREMFFRRSK